MLSEMIRRSVRGDHVRLRNVCRWRSTIEWAGDNHRVESRGVRVQNMERARRKGTSDISVYGPREMQVNLPEHNIARRRINWQRGGCCCQRRMGSVRGAYR
jgi:hypothetical protein